MRGSRGGAGLSGTTKREKLRERTDKSRVHEVIDVVVRRAISRPRKWYADVGIPLFSFHLGGGHVGAPDDAYVEVVPTRVAKVAPAEPSLFLRRKLAVEEAEDGPAAVFEIVIGVQAALVPEAETVLRPEQRMHVRFLYVAIADGLPAEDGPKVLQGPTFTLVFLASVQVPLVLR